MCQFYSCIIDRNFNLYDDPTVSDSHEHLVTKYKLDDSKLKDRDIVRIEVNPNFEKLTERFEKSDWKYKVDEPGTVPNWYAKNKKKAEKKVWDRIKEIYKTLFLFGGEYNELNEPVMILVKDARIKELKTQIKFMLGSSQVGKMRDSSQVGVMRGSSQVGVMLGSSRVGLMRGSSRVGEMWDSSQVGKMWDSSQVGMMQGSSRVGEMLDSSQVGKMRDSSQVGKMRDSSQVGEMWGSSTATKCGNGAKVQNQSGGKTVVIDRSKEKVKVTIK